MKYYASENSEISEMEQKHAEIVRKAAGECMVILENEGILPLEKTTGSLALYGMGARYTIKGGTGSGDVNSRYNISIEEGLRENGFEISSLAWLDQCNEVYESALENYRKHISGKMKEENISRVAAELAYPFSRPEEPLITENQLTADREIAVYVIARDSGEGADRKCEKGDYYLYDAEEKNLKMLSDSYENVIVLLNVGGIIDLSLLREMEHVRAVVLTGQGGSQGGYAVADVLTGKTIPSGKLTDTWAAKYSDYNCYDTFSYQNGNVDDEYYQEEGIFLWIGCRVSAVSGIL